MYLEFKYTLSLTLIINQAHKIMLRNIITNEQITYNPIL